MKINNQFDIETYDLASNPWTSTIDKIKQATRRIDLLTCLDIYLLTNFCCVFSITVCFRNRGWGGISNQKVETPFINWESNWVEKIHVKQIVR